MKTFKTLPNAVPRWGQTAMRLLCRFALALLVPASGQPQLPKPDLVITSGTPTATPSTVEPGGTFQLSAFTVTNMGTVGRTVGFGIGIYLSTDTVYGGGDTILDGVWKSRGLGAGASFTLGVRTLTIPAGTTPGDYYIIIALDYSNSVAESNENNNYVSVPITVVPLKPDLVITSGPPVATPSTVEPGGVVQVSGWTVKNQGNGASGPFSNGYYGSADSVITASDVYLGGNLNPSLSPGASKIWPDRVLQVPTRTPPGTYYIGILVDDGNAVSESNENNNSVSVPITVVPLKQPDLVITSGPPVATPSTVEPGGVVQVSGWTVKNQGDRENFTFSNGFYLSTDSVITTADTHLGGNSNPNLLPGSSTNWPGSTLTVPPGTAPGTYYLGILVDITNAGDESNENNNYVSVPLTVVPGRPVISAEDGVVNAASFLPGGSSAAWITIFGANLAPSTRMWGESDFVDNKLPTQLDGVSVNINGKPGYLYYISPTQINVLAPDDPAQGPIEVEVITALGRSDPVVAQKDWVSPAFFMLYPEEQKYVAAVHVDGTYVGKAGLFEGALPTRPVKPGDVIMLFGNGFGPTDPSWPTEELVGEAAPLSIPVTVRIGGSSAIVHFAGLVSSGLYQFNVTIPEVPDGDQPVVAGVAGFHSQDGAFITVQR